MILKTLGSTEEHQDIILRHRCNTMYNNNEIKKILTTKNSSGYEILIIEPMATECASHIASILQILVVYLIPSPISTFIEPMIFGHIPNPAVLSNILNNHAFLRKFGKRCINSLLLAYSLISREYHEWIIKITQPQFYDLIETIKPSILFVNSHHITEQSRPVPPNFIPISGIHLSQPKNISKVS